MNNKVLDHKCSIILVTHNDEQFLSKNIECIRQQTVQPNQIILTDSGSTDPSYISKYTDIDIVYKNTDIGFCIGNNLGYSRINDECEFVLFLNPDAFLEPDYLEKSITYMNDHPNCGALTGTILGYDIHQDQPTGRVDTTGISQKFYGKWQDRNQGEKYTPNLFQKPEEIQAICGAVFFCRRNALDTVLNEYSEVMDSSFFMYKEDIDLSLKLRHKGWSLQFVPSITSYHCRGWQRDRKKMPREFRLYSTWNEVRLHWRHSLFHALPYSVLKYFSVLALDL